MNHISNILVTVLGCYFLGSFPSAYLIGKVLRGVDIRRYGSGNVGTMNTRAVLGWSAALPVFVLDVGKGALAAWLSSRLGQDIFLGTFLAVLGHILPVWLKFKGGKGLATGFGGLAIAGAFAPVLVFSGLWLLTYPFAKNVDVSNLLGIVAAVVYTTIRTPDPWMLCLLLIILIPHIRALYKN